MNIVLIITKHEWWERLLVAAAHSLWIGAVVAAFLWVVTKGMDAPRARHNFALTGVLLTLLLPLTILFQPGYSVSTPNSSDHEWQAMIAAFWVAAASGLTLLIALRLINLTRLRVRDDSRLNEAMSRGSSTHGLGLAVRGGVTDRILTPAATSHRVLMPSECLDALDDKELDAVIAHEIAHIARRDFAVNILLNIAEAALFFNPFLWYLTARVRVERELCCDDVAVEKTGDRLHYARALAKLSCVREPHPALAVAMADARVSHRIRRLNQAKPHQRGFFIPAAAGLMAMTLLGIGFVRSFQQSPFIGWSADRPHILTKTEQALPLDFDQDMRVSQPSSSVQGQMNYEIRIETSTLVINDRAPY